MKVYIIIYYLCLISLMIIIYLNNFKPLIMLEAIVKMSSDDTHVYYTLYVWNGKQFIIKDVKWQFWDDDNDQEIIDTLTKGFNNYQVLAL
jgi:hypothetical protein